MLSVRGKNNNNTRPYGNNITETEQMLRVKSEYPPRARYCRVRITYFNKNGGSFFSFEFLITHSREETLPFGRRYSAITITQSTCASLLRIFQHPVCYWSFDFNPNGSSPCSANSLFITRVKHVLQKTIIASE